VSIAITGIMSIVYFVRKYLIASSFKSESLNKDFGLTINFNPNDKTHASNNESFLSIKKIFYSFVFNILKYIRQFFRFFF
jgi:hypothetical protein